MLMILGREKIPFLVQLLLLDGREEDGLNKARCGDSDWHKSASIIKGGRGLLDETRWLTATGTLQPPL